MDLPQTGVDSSSEVPKSVSSIIQRFERISSVDSDTGKEKTETKGTVMSKVGDIKEVDNEKMTVSGSESVSLDICDNAAEVEVSRGTQMRHIVEDIEAKAESISKHLVESDFKKNGQKITVDTGSDIDSFHDNEKVVSDIPVEEKRRSVRELVQQHESLVTQSSLEKDKNKELKSDLIRTEEKAEIDHQEQHALFEIEVTNFEVAESFEKAEDEKVEIIPWSTEPNTDLVQDEPDFKEKPCHYAEETVSGEWQAEDKVETLEEEEPCTLPSPEEQEYPVCTAVEQEVIEDVSYDKSSEIEDVQIDRLKDQKVDSTVVFTEVDLVNRVKETECVQIKDGDSESMVDTPKVYCHEEEDIIGKTAKVTLGDVEYQSGEMVECEELESSSLQQLSEDYQKADDYFTSEVSEVCSSDREKVTEIVETSIITAKESAIKERAVLEYITRDVSEEKCFSEEDGSKLLTEKKAVSEPEIAPVVMDKDSAKDASKGNEDENLIGECVVQKYETFLYKTRESESPVSDEDLVEKPTHVSRDSSIDTEDVLKERDTVVENKEPEQQQTVEIKEYKDQHYEEGEDSELPEDDTFPINKDFSSLDDKKVSKIYKQKVLLSRQESNIEITLDECGEREHESDEAEDGLEKAKPEKKADVYKEDISEPVEDVETVESDKIVSEEKEKPLTQKADDIELQKFITDTVDEVKGKSETKTDGKMTDDSVKDNLEEKPFLDKAGDTEEIDSDQRYDFQEVSESFRDKKQEQDIVLSRTGHDINEVMEEYKERLVDDIVSSELDTYSQKESKDMSYTSPPEDVPMEETHLHGHVYSDILLAADEEMCGEPLGFSVEPSSEDENEYIETQEDSVKFDLAEEADIVQQTQDEYATEYTAKVIEVIEGDEVEGSVPFSPSALSETFEIDTSELLKQTTSDYDLALSYVDRVEHCIDVQRKPSLTSMKSEEQELEVSKSETCNLEHLAETGKDVFKLDTTDFIERDIEYKDEYFYEVDEFDETYIDRTEHFLELDKDDVELLGKRKTDITLRQIPPKEETQNDKSQKSTRSDFLEEEDSTTFCPQSGGLQDRDADSVEDEEINSFIEQKSKASTDAERQSIKSSERPLSPSDYTLEMDLDENGLRDASRYVDGDDEDYDEEEPEGDHDEEQQDVEDPMSADVSQQIFIEHTIEQEKSPNHRHPLEGEDKTEEIPPSPSEYTLVTSYEQEKLKQVLETPEKKVSQVVRIAREEGLSVSMDETVLKKELGLEKERNVMSASYDEEAIKYVYDEEDIMVSSVEHVMQDSLIASSIEPDEIRVTGSICSGRDDDISSSEHKSLSDSMDQDSLQKSVGSARESELADSMDPDMLQKSFSREEDMMTSSMDASTLQRALDSTRDDLMSGSMDTEALRRSLGLDQQDMTDSLEQDQLQRCLDVVTEEVPLTTSLDDKMMEQTLGFGKGEMESSDEQDGLKVAVGIDRTADLMTTSLEFDDLDALHRSLGLAPSESIDSSSRASEATHEPESTEISETMLESMDDDAFRMSLNLKREDPMVMSMDSESLTKSLEIENHNLVKGSIEPGAMKVSLGLDRITSDSEEESESDKVIKQMDPMMMSMDENALQSSLGFDNLKETKKEEVLTPEKEYSKGEICNDLTEDILTTDNDLKVETTADTVTTEDTNAMKESLEEYPDELDKTTNGDSEDAALALHDTGT